MTVRATYAVLSLLVLTGCADDGNGSGSPRSRPTAQVGAEVPALETRTLDGRPVSLADLRGSPVLLNIWATWCHPCQDEIPVLEALHREHGPHGLRIIGVTIDDAGRADDVRGFARRFGMTYEVWHDADQRVMPAFSVLGVPTTFVIGRDGRLIWRKTGEVKAGDPQLNVAIDSAFASAG